MRKIILSIFVLVLLLFPNAGCFTKSDNMPSKRELLQFALFNQIPDIYSATLFEYFKKRKIKTISFVSKNLETKKIDSLTFLEINNDGKLIRRTTKECTTIGCLPYMNRQDYHYLKGRLKRIDISTFKKNNMSTRSEWSDTDTASLNKFDWNTYSYSNDTIFVETAISLYKYVKNSSGDIISRYLFIKSTHQYINNNITYTNSTIKNKVTNSFNNVTEDYKFNGNKIELWEINNNRTELAKSWIIGSNGLINEIYYYKNGKIIFKTHLSYTFYS